MGSLVSDRLLDSELGICEMAGIKVHSLNVLRICVLCEMLRFVAVIHLGVSARRIYRELRELMLRMLCQCVKGPSFELGYFRGLGSVKHAR
jgi:hypothetical protein